jgi:uncharacterized alkaline shock family protein YloU
MTTTVRRRTTESTSAGRKPLELGDQPATANPEGVSISEAVIEKIAATAARSVPGMHPAGDLRGFANGLVRAIGTRRRSGTAGIKARIRGNREVSLAMRMAVDYGENIPSLSREMRFTVAKAIREMTGLDTREIKVKITEVLLREGEATTSGPAKD